MAMGGMQEFQCTLLGTVVVNKSMRNLESHQRLRMAKICHKAIVNREILDSDRTWLVNPEYFYTTDDLTLRIDYNTKDIALYDKDDMISKHPVATISAIVTLDGSDGHLVYIGHCSKSTSRMAVVLSFSSLSNANSMVKYFEDLKGQDSVGVNVMPSNISGQQQIIVASSPPPPIPKTPKPLQATQPPLPPRPPKKDVCDGNTNDIDDEEENYVNDNEEEETENNYEEEDIEYEDPENVTLRKNQPELPPRNNSDTNSRHQSTELMENKPESSNTEKKGEKGFIQKVAFWNKKPKPNNQKVKTPESKPSQAEKRPLPGPPGKHLSNSNQISDTSASSKNSCQASNFDDDIYVNDTFYDNIGLDTKDQENIYMSMPSENNNSSPRLISNGIEYLLENEQKYLITSEKLADGKKLFPVEIQPFLGPIEKLPELHKDLYEALNATKDSTAEIAKAFINRKELFKEYQTIIENAFTVEKKMKNISKDEKAKIQELHEPLRQARKRLHFYFMHLDGLLSSASEQEKIYIHKAVDILKDYYKAGDTGILIKSIRKSPIELKLYKPLHLHSMINVSGPHITNKEYRVLLFEEIIVISLQIEDDHEYQLDIRMELVKVNDNSIDPKTLTLYVDHGGVRKKENYNFRFNDVTVKQAWNNAILAIQQRYMKRIRDSIQ